MLRVKKLMNRMPNNSAAPPAIAVPKDIRRNRLWDSTIRRVLSAMATFPTTAPSIVAGAQATRYPDIARTVAGGPENNDGIGSGRLPCTATVASLPSTAAMATTSRMRP